MSKPSSAVCINLECSFHLNSFERKISLILHPKSSKLFLAHFLSLTLSSMGGFCRDEDEDDGLFFGPRNPLLFSLDPDPTCNNGFIDLFSKNKPESTNSSLV